MRLPTLVADGESKIRDPTGCLSAAPKAVMERRESAPDPEMLVDGEAYFAALFDALDRATTYAQRGAATSCIIYAYRLSPDIAPAGFGQAQPTLVDRLSQLVDADANVHVRLSSHLNRIPNIAASQRLRSHGVPVSWSRSNSVRSASHEKFAAVSTPDGVDIFVGSLDPWAPRWDSGRHDFFEGARQNRFTAPSHDVGMRLRLGPNELTNDSIDPFDLTDLWRAVRKQGIDVVHKVGVDDESLFEVFAETVREARDYIYIEDQYFLPDIPSHGDGARTSLSSLIAERVRSGVDLFVVLPAPSLRGAPRQHIETRSAAMLANISESAGNAGGRIRALGRCAVDRSTGRTRKLYIHSKLVIVDDVVALIGSANLTSRSVRFDDELVVRLRNKSVVSPLRAQLWAEHLGNPPEWAAPDDIVQQRKWFAETPAGPLSGLIELSSRSKRRSRRRVGDHVFRLLVDPIG